VAPDLTLGLPRKEKKIFDPKLNEVEIEEFSTEDSGYIEDEIIPPPVETPKTVTKDERNFRYLRLVGIIISLFASFVSWVNSFEWFTTVRPNYVAIPMAFTIIGASVLLPDFGILLWKAKKRIIGSLILFSGVIATLICMATTVAALYNSRSWNIEDDTLAAADATRATATLKEREADRKRIVEQIASQEKLIASTQAKIDALTAEETVGTVSQTLQRRLNGYIADRKAYEAQLATNDEAIRVAREKSKNVSERNDIYSFLGGIFGIPPTQAEFFTVSIPAVFLEVVAPVMIAVALFL